jgi:hypothetical protein
MSAFNILRATVRCSNCNEAIARLIQFKYGDRWQHEYQVGDTLRWGGNDTGKLGARRVRVRGTSPPEPCPACGFEDAIYLIVVERDVITGLSPSSNEELRIPEGESFSIEEMAP